MLFSINICVKNIGCFKRIDENKIPLVIEFKFFNYIDRIQKIFETKRFL